MAALQHIIMHPHAAAQQQRQPSGCSQLDTLKTYLVFIVIALAQEGHQLLAGALLSQGQRDGAEALDAVQAQRHILVLELISAERKQSG